MSRAVETPGSVLIYVGWDFVGDGLMKLPFLRALRNAFPDAEITWLAGKGKSAYAHTLAPLVGGLLDNVVEEGNVGQRWTEMFRPALAGTGLEGRPFDLIIDAQRRVGASFLIRRTPHRCFVSGAGRYLLSDLRPANWREKPPSMVRQMLDLAELASGRAADTSGEPPAMPELDALAAEVLPQDASSGGEPYIGLAPGAGSAHKRWPLERYLELGAAQIAAGRRPVVFLGPEESAWTLRVREALPTAVLPLQAEAVARLGPSALITIALARRLSAAVANDAGVGHMLAAANCPLVSLFGPTSPEKSAPLGGPARVLRAQDHFRDGGSDAQADSMENIPLAAVREAVDNLLEEETESPAALRPRGGESRSIGGEAR